MSSFAISTVGLDTIAITKLKANMLGFLIISEKFQMEVYFRVNY